MMRNTGERGNKKGGDSGFNRHNTPVHAFFRKVREGQRSASRPAGTGPLIVQIPSPSFFGV
jgi:hypothetical protein